MARGRNPDGTPKRYPGEARRERKPRRRLKPGDLNLTLENPPQPHYGPPNHWTENPAILSRLEVVEAYRLAGNSARETSRILGLPYEAVQNDYGRLSELWLARIGRTQDDLRAEAMRRLDVVIREGLATLRQDEAYTQAVLFNLPTMVMCNGRQEHRPEDMLLVDPLQQPTGTVYGEAFSCVHPHQMLRRVHHDEKGSAQYRRVAGQVLTAINSAIMNQARIMGLVVEKKALTDTEGNDLPAALKAILLGEDGLPDQDSGQHSDGRPRPPALPERSLDVGLT